MDDLQEIVVILDEKSSAIFVPKVLAPFTVKPTLFEGRKTLEVSFRARDCGFIPGGNVDVFTNNGHTVVFDQVIEIRIGNEVKRNRWLCPKCHRLTLKSTSVVDDDIKHPTRFQARCQFRGCDGNAIIS
jgi:hypothetical protein